MLEFLKLIKNKDMDSKSLKLNKKHKKYIKVNIMMINSKEMENYSYLNLDTIIKDNLKITKFQVKDFRE